MSDQVSKVNYTRVARPVEPILDLTVAPPERVVEYSTRRRAVQPILDLSKPLKTYEESHGLQSMSTPELLVFLKVNRVSREQLLQIHEIAVERLMNEDRESASQEAELSRAAMATALECAK